MKQLIQIALTLAGVFIALFLLMRLTGVFSSDDIKLWLAQAAQLDKLYVAGIIVLLLVSDLLIAVPTMATCILAGYFLGFFWGGLTASLGMLMAGSIGFGICRRYGANLLSKIYPDPEKLKEMQQLFYNQGSKVILISRALPMLPEICACLAGANHMPYGRFIVFFALATLPYAFIAALAGSHSSLSNPTPALATAVFMSVSLWAIWFCLLRPKTSRIQ